MKFFKFSIFLGLWSLALLAAPNAGRSHEPITTKVMFNREIIRILDENCLGCHAPGKIKDDIPLTTYEEARPWAKAIKEEVLEKRMMPYQAIKGYGNFHHDYTLKQRDVELLISWIEGGAPRGEAKDYPAERIQKLIAGSEWKLGEPDLILQPEQDIKIVSEDASPNRCLSLPLDLKEDHFLTGLDFHPGNGAVVYGASFAIESNANSKSCGAGQTGFTHWVPGQAVIKWPAGFGVKVPAGSRLAVRITYRTNGEPATDRSKIGLYFGKTPAYKSIQTLSIAPKNAIELPANQAGIRAKATQALSEATEIIALRPMLFPFATSMEVTAHRPDGTSEVLLWVRDYRFDWQPNYFLKKPFLLPRGTRIEITAYYDNSDENKNNPNDPPAQARIDSPFCEIAYSSARTANRPVRK
jgi:hypothetical protein